MFAIVLYVGRILTSLDVSGLKVVIFMMNDNKTRVEMGKPAIRFGDIYQTASRVPTSEAQAICTTKKSFRLLLFQLFNLRPKLCNLQLSTFNLHIAVRKK